MKQDRTRPPQGAHSSDAASARGHAPGKATLTESLPADDAPVQRKQSLATALSPEATHAAAAEGVRGGGEPLPFREQIQASFGAHDIGDVRAHVGGDAAAASQAIGAR